jgi:MFS family permease
MKAGPQTAALLVGAAFLFMAGGMMGFVLPVRGADEGFSTGFLGLIGSAYSVGYVLGCIVAPRLVCRVGHVRTFGALAALVTITALLTALLVLPLPWILLRMVTGFAFAGTTMIIESWLNEAAGESERGRVFARYMLVNLAGAVLGQLGAGLIGTAGFEPFVAAAILGCLALLPTALSSGRAPEPLARARLDLQRLFRVSPIAAVGCCAIGLANGAFGTLAVVWARSVGLEVGMVAIFATATIAGGAIAQVPMGRLSDRIDRRLVLVGVALAAAGASLAFILLEPDQPAAALALGFLLGAAIYSLYPIAVAHANDLAGSGRFVAVGGGLLLLYGFGASIGPSLAALAMVWVGPHGLYGYLISVYLPLAIYGGWRMLRRPGQAAKLEGFVELPMPRGVTPETARLDPRSA